MTVPALPDSWVAPFDDLIDWITEPVTSSAADKIAAAHIKAPRASGKTTVIPGNVWKRLTTAWPNSSVLFITSPSEAVRVSHLYADEVVEDPKPMIVDSYTWLMGSLPTQWNKAERRYQDITENVVIVIDMETSDFPFNTTMAQFHHWAGSRSGEAFLRIVTMSSEDLDSRFMRLTSCSVRHFLFPLGRHGTMYDQPLRDLDAETVDVLVTDEYDCTSAVAAAIEQDSASQHVVLCFQPWDRVVNLTIAGVHLESYHTTARQSDRAIQDMLNTQSDQSKTVKLIYMTRPSARGITLIGYRVWLLPCLYFPLALILDDNIGQLIYQDVRPSIHQQLDVLSWARRADRSTFVTWADNNVSSTYGTMELFGVEAEQASTHTFENTALGLFTCFLADLHTNYDIDFWGTLRILCRNNGSNASGMARRLIYQGVISQDATYKITGSSRRIFEGALVHLQSDYSLSLLLARSSTDPTLNHVMIRMIAVMNHGSALMEDNALDRVSLTGLLGQCSGYTANFAGHGTWWMILGLWHNIVLDGGPQLARTQATTKKQRSSLKIEGVKVEFANLAHRPLIDLMTALEDILRRNGIPVDSSYDETDSLSKEQYLTLSRTLVKVFAFNIVEVTRDADDKITFTLLSSRKSIRILAYVYRMVQRLMVQGSLRKVHGFTIGFEKRNGEVCAADWTMIDPSVYQAWKRENHPGDAALSSLRWTRSV